MFYIGDNASKSNADVHDSNLLDQKTVDAWAMVRKARLVTK